ncbi:MAG TPA: cation transporter [Terricaulis sp.]|nr:cation transporter [Terricaulis sp.]
MTGEPSPARQRRILGLTFGLNVLLAAGLAVGGWTADSSSLLANAVDNASDSVVYALSLFAVGAGARWKRAAATVSGALLIVFAIGVLGDTARRYIFGSEPIGATMMTLAIVAAIINLVCLRLMQSLKTSDPNIKAARTFSFNDFIGNGGILLAGAAVAWTGQQWPDLVVGAAVAAISLKGGVAILRDASDHGGQ